MAKLGYGSIGGTIIDHREAQRAESVLKAANVEVFPWKESPTCCVQGWCVGKATSW